MEGNVLDWRVYMGLKKFFTMTHHARLTRRQRTLLPVIPIEQSTCPAETSLPAGRAAPVPLSVLRDLQRVCSASGRQEAYRPGRPRCPERKDDPCLPGNQHRAVDLLNRLVRITSG